MIDWSGRVLRERYRIVEKIGEGAMSEVYLAVHPRHSGVRYALKVLKQNLIHQTDLGHRFREEGRLLERLDHPGIVRVHECFEDGGALCMALAFVDGRSLGEALRAGGAMKPSIALPMFKIILAALDYAHRAGVIHRDVKPSNILIDRDGRPQLCDFGIARQVGQRGVTATGMTLGTPQYMSPEQIQAPQTIDHRSDLYSAGIMLYEMLTGKVPFGDAPTVSDYAILQQQVQAEPPDPRTFNPDLEAALCGVLKKALRKDPTRRYQGGSEFWQAIERATGGGGSQNEAKPSMPPVEVMDHAGSRRYVVYRHAVRGHEAVKVGFSWPALFFGPAWMLVKRLFGYALLWLVAASIVFFARGGAVRSQPNDVLTESLIWLLIIVSVAIWILPAARGNNWREDSLVKHGYEFVGEVRAPSADAALAQVGASP